MNYRESAQQIFLAGVKGVMPGRIISDVVSLRGDILKIGYHEFDLARIERIFVIGAGKASAAMGHFVEAEIGSRISDGHIITKYGCYCQLKRIKVTEAGHPVPDENGFNATREVLKIADAAGEKDLVICLWSGGGSALLADYPQSSSPEEIQLLNDLLVRSGADITEMNSVRKHLSAVKGGHLARHIYPAQSISIILSDVIGDPFDVIASGPTVPDNSTFTGALGVIEKYDLGDQIPGGLKDYLLQGANGVYPETPKEGDHIFSRCITFLAGNNRTALKTALDEAEKLDMQAFIVTSRLMGDMASACEFILNTINEYRNNQSLKRPVCLLFGGETTIKVTGNGAGGRNQHLALAIAMRIKDIPGVTFLSAGTDGNDGNTEMAGAVVDSETVHDALTINADPERYLLEFDSYNFFKAAGGHIFTGPTLTNVMDLAVAVIG